jgi:rRNA maturation protein Nop10
MESDAVSATEISGAGGIDANLAPDAFHRWGTHYYKCRQDFEIPHPHRFSPVPYFLLCRAIELELKSRHLHAKRQLEVKRVYGHHLNRAYADLPPSEQVLTPEEALVLEQASAIYASKGFEYFDPEDGMTAYRRFPDLSALDRVAHKLLRIETEAQQTHAPDRQQPASPPVAGR